MHLSRFGVKNYKCLGEIDIPLTPIHVLIGENDAGKTSLLQALAAFCASSEQESAAVFPRPWSGRELVRHGWSQPTIELCGEWTNATPSGPDLPIEYGFGVTFSQSGMECTIGEEWVRTDGETRTIASKSNKSAGTRLRQWKRRQAISPGGPHADLEVLAKVVRAVHQYALDPKLMAVPAAIDPRRKFRLDPDGFGLATLLDDIVAYEAQLFINLREEFCTFFPQFRSVRLESEDSLQRDYASSGLHRSRQGPGKTIYFETQDGQKVRAQQASDGAILFLAFLALVYLPDPPSLLLIEEPENAIYPKRLKEVITMLRQMVERAEGVRFPQIILTTHSPYVLSFFEPEEVTFLSRPKGQPDAPVRARPLREAPNIKERLGDDFYLGELWYNLSEEDLFGES